MMKQTSWTRWRILKLLEENDRAVEKALLVVYHNQRADEKRDERTKHRNLTGFCKRDGNIMASMAKHCIRTGHLTEAQIKALRQKDKRGISRIGKYWRQIQEEIIRKGN